jgi:SepF-like predicted cell division protein (DUF552 family)
MKRLFGTKSKNSSKYGKVETQSKVETQKSSGEKEMEIEYENVDSGEDISDGNADSL